MQSGSVGSLCCLAFLLSFGIGAHSQIKSIDLKHTLYKRSSDGKFTLESNTTDHLEKNFTTEDSIAKNNRNSEAIGQQTPETLGDSHLLVSSDATTPQPSVEVTTQHNLTIDSGAVVSPDSGKGLDEVEQNNRIDAHAVAQLRGSGTLGDVQLPTEPQTIHEPVQTVREPAEIIPAERAPNVQNSSIPEFVKGTASNNQPFLDANQVKSNIELPQPQSTDKTIYEKYRRFGSLEDSNVDVGLQHERKGPFAYVNHNLEFNLDRQGRTSNARGFLIKIVQKSELIYLESIPGAENLIKCTREGEIYNLRTPWSECMTCSCTSERGRVQPVCASCSTCAGAPTPASQTPNIQPQATQPWSSIQNQDLESNTCAPYPYNRQFEHPLNPCEICICKKELQSLEVQIRCTRNPQCVDSPSYAELSASTTASTSIMNLVCAKFPKGVTFTHPTEACQLCKCQDEVSLSGNIQTQLVCVQDFACSPDVLSSGLSDEPKVIVEVNPKKDTFTKLYPNNIIPKDLYNSYPIVPQTSQSYAEGNADELQSRPSVIELQQTQEIPTSPNFNSLPTQPQEPEIYSTQSGSASGFLPQGLKPNFPTQKTIEQEFSSIMSIPQSELEKTPDSLSFLPKQVGPNLGDASASAMDTSSQGSLPWPPLIASNKQQQRNGPLLGPPPHKSCYPYPSHTRFQHPWNECQECVCAEYTQQPSIYIEVNCYTKPSCCIQPMSTDQLSNQSTLSSYSNRLVFIEPKCRSRPPEEKFHIKCNECVCRTVYNYVIADCTPLPHCSEPVESIPNRGSMSAQASYSQSVRPTDLTKTLMSNMQQISDNNMYTYGNSKPGQQYLPAPSLASLFNPSSTAGAGGFLAYGAPAYSYSTYQQQVSPQVSTTVEPTVESLAQFINSIGSGQQYYPSYPPTFNTYPMYVQPRSEIGRFDEPATNFGAETKTHSAYTSTYGLKSMEKMTPSTYQFPAIHSDRNKYMYSLPIASTTNRKLSMKSLTASSTSKNNHDDLSLRSRQLIETRAGGGGVGSQHVTRTGDPGPVTRTGRGPCQFAGDAYHARCQACYCLADDARPEHLYSLCYGKPCD